MSQGYFSVLPGSLLCPICWVVLRFLVLENNVSPFNCLVLRIHIPTYFEWCKCVNKRCLSISGRSARVALTERLTETDSGSSNEFFWAPKPKLAGLHPYKYTVVYQPVYNAGGWAMQQWNFPLKQHKWGNWMCWVGGTSNERTVNPKCLCRVCSGVNRRLCDCDPSLIKVWLQSHMEAGAVWANVFLEALNSMKLISESVLSTLETIVIWAAAFNVFEL